MIKLKKEGEYLMGYNENNVACCYYPLTKEAKELDLLLLPNHFEDKVDVERLAEEYLQKWRGLNNVHLSNMIHADRCKNDFIEGYKAAQAKQYSLEDIEQILFGYDNVDWSKREHKKPTIMMKEWLKEKIQSLSTQRLPKEFEPIMYPKYTQYYGFEEDDEIPVMTPMTSTNSEGKQEIQGRYVY